MENGDETLAHPAAGKAAPNGGIVAEEEEVSATDAATHPAKSYAAAAAAAANAEIHPAKSYAAVAANAEIEDLRTAKVDLEEKLSAADRENKALAAEVHCLEGLVSQAQEEAASTEHFLGEDEKKVISLRSEAGRLQDLLEAEKREREAEKRNAELLIAALEDVRQVNVKLEKEIATLKDSTNAASLAAKKGEIARGTETETETPKEAEVAWQGMVAAAAVGAATTATLVLIYLRLKR